MTVPCSNCGYELNIVKSKMKIDFERIAIINKKIEATLLKIKKLNSSWIQMIFGSGASVAILQDDIAYYNRLKKDVLKRRVSKCSFCGHNHSIKFYD